MNSAELRERLGAIEAGFVCICGPEVVCVLCAVREAAAALERLEALEAALAAWIDADERADGSFCERDEALAEIARGIRERSTPAPASQQGGSDG